MGTNYYAVGREACGECGKPYDDKSIHIGKSSMGWQFSFAWNDGDYYKTPDEFKAWLNGKKILDGYDREVTHKEFWDLVEAKKEGLNTKTYYEKYPERNTHNFDPDEHEFEIQGFRFIKGEFS